MTDKRELSVTIIEANNLVKYFNAKIIGSALLEQKGILDYKYVNDVDVAIPQSVFWNVKDYLSDRGFKETEQSYRRKGYADFIGSLIFKKEHHLPIHISFIDKDFKEKSIPEIIKGKFERYSVSDRRQLMNIIESNKDNSIWKTDKGK